MIANWHLTRLRVWGIMTVQMQCFIRGNTMRQFIAASGTIQSRLAGPLMALQPGAAFFVEVGWVFMSQLEVPSNKNIHNAVKKAKQARFEHGEKP